MKRLIYNVVSFLLVLATLQGCAPVATPPTAAPATEAPAAVAPVAKEAPTQAAVQPTEIPYPEPPVGTMLVDTSRWKKNGPWTIGYSNPSTSNSWRVMTVASILYAAQEMYPDQIKGLVITNANDSIPKQISDMEDMLVKGVDAIIIAPTDGDALCPAIDKAMSQGVPVIVLERGVNCTNYITFIDANARGQAGFQAQWLVDQLGGQGNVVYMGIIPGITISTWTEETVNGVFAANPGITTLTFDYAWVSRSKGKTLMEAWLRAYPEIDGVIGWSGAEVMGALEAAQEAGRDMEVKAWVGADDMGWLQLIAAGKVNGAGYIGYADCTVDALQAAIRILNGQAVPYYWKLPVIGITEDNVSQYVIPDGPATWFPSRFIPADQMQEWIDTAGSY